MKKFLEKRKKNSTFFWTKFSLCPTYQEFWPGSTVGVCALKIVDSTSRGQRNKCKILSKEKKKKIESIFYENAPGSD